MNIDSMKVAIRPMSTVQAIDLGMAMARHWFIPLWKIWMLMALPIYLGLYLVGIVFSLLYGLNAEAALSTVGTIAGIVFWWLKPIFEKPMVTWLGQALFTDPPAIKSTAKTGWKTATAYAFTLLIKKRLSLKRQLILPILMLEKPNHAQFKQRLQILSQGQGGGLGWHTTLMVNIEFIVSLGAVALLWQLIPTGLVKAETMFVMLQYTPLWAQVIWSALYLLAVSLVAPFFVASGFAVYLTKRCLLEGWDVELVFKALRQRYLESQSHSINETLGNRVDSLTPDNRHTLKPLNTHETSGSQPL